ncbi:hypothetical protein PY365_03535 [Roseiarcaceae bacterium H3SJ34-1]|uniref:hypothetical protein n=1 Tax=Terripilifer ovatus TaxID=3032367 RepID=UPI003AB9930B|nr:hypothetical protein [Roseiarcaceae bacterium H3SJ34-1]
MKKPIITPPPGRDPIAPSAAPIADGINERNRDFWKGRQAEFERRYQDPGLVSAAAAQMEKDRNDGVPAAEQKPFDRLLEDAELVRTLTRRREASRSGSSKRSNSLNRLIDSVVEIYPKISEQPLLVKLEANSRLADDVRVVIEIDSDEISYMDNEVLKTAPLSTLKDRLYHAKERLKKRTSSL